MKLINTLIAMLTAISVGFSATADVLPPGQTTDASIHRAAKLAELGCDFERDMIGYAINADGSSVTVKCAVLGSMSLQRALLPATVTYEEKSYTVTEIAPEAFRNLSTLSIVAIPATVTRIGKDAFRGCPLQAVSISDLRAWCAIIFDNYTANPASVAGCLMLGDEPLTDLVLPDSITKINNHAFDGLTSLRSVVFPEGLRTIGRSAFFGCTGLTELRLPDSIITIDRCAFERCSGLTSVYIGDNAQFIGFGAFRDCSALRSISMPKGIRTIRHDAFDGVKAKTERRKVKK